MLRTKHKLSLKIQTKLTKADMGAYAVSAVVQKHSLGICNTQKISLVISFLSGGLSVKHEFN
jgi:hypothetical protein